MSLLSSIITGKSARPPRLIIYGTAGIGKTSMAANAPDPIMIDIEGGGDEEGVPRFPQAQTFDDVIRQIGVLLTDPHDYRTLIVDSLDWLEKLIWAKAAKRLNVPSIESVPYGKGYSEAVVEWKTFLRGLEALREKRGMAIILLAHNEVRRYEDPQSDPYDRHQIALHKVASALMQEWADAVLFYGWQVATKVADGGFGRRIVRGKGNGARLLHTEERPAALAKNRYAMPDILEMPDNPEGAWGELAAHIPYFSERSLDNTRHENAVVEG